MTEYRVIKGADGIPILVKPCNHFSSKLPFVEPPTSEQVKRVHDQQFQEMCKSLWPNIYKKVEEAEKEQKCKDLAKNFDNRTLCDALIKNAEQKECIESLLKAKNNLISSPKKSCCSDCETKKSCHNTVFQKMDAALGSTSSNGTPNINIYINGETTKKTCNQEPAPIVCSKPTTVMSSYNYPFCTTKYSEMREKECPKKFTDLLGMSVKPCLKSEDEILLNSIKQTQEKLKMTQKVENTTELVDDLITKFSLLQAEMKEKAANLNLKAQVQNDMEAIDREFLANRVSRSRSREVLSKSPCLSRSRSREVLCKSPCLSRSRESLCKSPCLSRSRESLCKSPYLSRSRESLCRSVSPICHSINLPRKCSKERPVSILKKCHRPKSPASVSFRVSGPKTSYKTNVSSSSDTYSSRDFFYVPPRVDCWNEKPKVDSNVY